MPSEGTLEIQIVRKLLEGFLKAESLNPWHYATLLNLAAYFQNQQNAIDAIRYYDRAITSNPVSWIAYQRRGALLAQQKKYDPAILDLEKALIIEPRNCTIRRLRQDLLKESGKPSSGDSELAKLTAEGRCKD